MASSSAREPVVSDSSGARDPRILTTGELGSEGGSAAELTQAERADRAESAVVRHGGSTRLVFTIVGIGIVLVLLILWFSRGVSQILNGG